MKRLLLSLTAVGMLAGLAIAPVVAAAASAIVEQAKDACVVGEQADGYLGFVPGSNATDELRREVRDINQQRKAIYADLARRNGVSTSVTAALTAEKLMRQASSGQCIRDQTGNWREV
ncbi:MAG: YdbL family protein [Marinicaulis sp.]|nr:YdbL family protein [Marinicaulis sp.]